MVPWLEAPATAPMEGTEDAGTKIFFMSQHQTYFIYSYDDSRNNYIDNEVALDYNAGFQSLIAGLI